MPKFPMTRCLACHATIKRDHEYHAEIIRTNITGWLDDLTSRLALNTVDNGLDPPNEFPTN